MAAPYETSFALRQLAVITSAWTDLQGAAVLPIPCNLVIVYNNSNDTVKMRTDPNNAASEIDLAPGQAFEIGSSSDLGQRSTGSFRFTPNGPPLASFESSTISVNLIIESLQ